jgi:antitoxin MazE
MAEHIKVGVGAPVEITEKQGGLFIRPTQVKSSLKELLAKVKPENLHGEPKTGRSVGKEVW